MRLISRQSGHLRIRRLERKEFARIGKGPEQKSNHRKGIATGLNRQSSKPVETPKPGDTAGSEETSGGSEDNTGNLPGDSSAGVSAGDRKNNYMTLVVRMADAEGNPAADLTVEIHSTPKTVRTSQNGIAVFAEVEEGRHTLYVQDEERNVLASKAFEIIFGENISLRGNQLLVRRGSALRLMYSLTGQN